jgi:hypothetical protein
MTLVCVPAVVCNLGLKSVDCGMARIDPDKFSLCGVAAEDACCGAPLGDVRDAFTSEVASELTGAVAESSGELLVFTGESAELSEELSNDALATCLAASPWPNQFSR